MLITLFTLQIECECKSFHVPQLALKLTWSKSTRKNWRKPCRTGGSLGGLASADPIQGGLLGMYFWSTSFRPAPTAQTSQARPCLQCWSQLAGGTPPGPPGTHASSQFWYTSLIPVFLHISHLMAQHSRPRVLCFGGGYSLFTHIFHIQVQYFSVPHRFLQDSKDSWGFLRIPQDYTII